MPPKNYLSRKGYAAWLVNAADFPRKAPINEQAEFLLKYAVLAPSTHNTQPWVFKINAPHYSKEGEVEFYLRGDLILPNSDTTGRHAYISLGCAIESFLIAANYFGFEFIVNNVESARLSAGNIFVTSVKIKENGHGPLHGSERLFLAITKRSSARVPFANELPPQNLLEELQKKAATLKAATVHWITAPDQIKDVAQIVSDSILHAFSMRNFRIEHAAWVRSNSIDTYDGIPGFTAGIPSLVCRFAPFFMGNINMGPVRAKMVKKEVGHGPLIGVITGKDNAVGWNGAGRTFMQCILGLLAHGFSSSVFAGPIEFDNLAERLRALVQADSRPLVLFRAGRALSFNPPGPRRPVEMCLLNKIYG